MPGHLDVIEIPSADPITVALGGNNDIGIAQLHDDGRSACERNCRGDPHAGEALQWKMMRDVEIETLRNRIAQLAAKGREQEREAAAWLLAEVIMRGPAGFSPGRRQ